MWLSWKKSHLRYMQIYKHVNILEIRAFLPRSALVRKKGRLLVYESLAHHRAHEVFLLSAALTRPQGSSPFHLPREDQAAPSEAWSSSPALFHGKHLTSSIKCPIRNKPRSYPNTSTNERLNVALFSMQLIKILGSDLRTL